MFNLKNFKLVREIKNITRRFLILLGFSCLMAYMLIGFYYLEDSITLTQVKWIGVAALLGAISSLVFLSSEELTDKQWWMREIICLLICEVVYIFIYRHIGLVTDAKTWMIVFVTIIIFGFANHIIDYSVDYSLSEKINEKLKKRHNIN